VHLLDVRSGRDHRVTWFGQPPRRGYTWAVTLLDGWSPDSGQLLLAVVPGETTSEEGELKVPPANYGFYIFDVSNGRAHQIILPTGFQFLDWLPDGRFLGVVPGQRAEEAEKAVLIRWGSAQGREVKAAGGHLSQVRSSPDGRWLIGLLVLAGGQRGKAEIVKINVATSSSVRLASLTSSTGNEQPALSPPDGKHFSYKRETRTVQRAPEDTLVVDGRALYSCHGPVDYRWVGDRSIALTCENQIFVLDPISGRVLGLNSPQP
jgi:hypothetical protein